MRLAILTAFSFMAAVLAGCVSDAPAGNGTGGSGSIGAYSLDDYLISSYPTSGGWELGGPEYADAFELEGGNPGNIDPNDFCLGEEDDGPCPSEVRVAILVRESEDGSMGISISAQFAPGDLDDEWLQQLCDEQGGDGLSAKHGNVLLILGAYSDTSAGNNAWDEMVTNLLDETGAKSIC